MFKILLGATIFGFALAAIGDLLISAGIAILVTTSVVGIVHVATAKSQPDYDRAKETIMRWL